VPRAVVFLVAARALVLLDDVALVFVDEEAAGDAGLDVGPHAQPVEVKRRLSLGDERRAAAQRGEIRRRAGVDGIAVRVGPLRQIDLGPGDVKKIERIA
jgi:hypothetical protein